MRGSREGGIGNAECGKAEKKGMGRCGRWNWECGLRPLRAVGSTLYEPEAVGAIGVYAPEGRRNKKGREHRRGGDWGCGARGRPGDRETRGREDWERGKMGKVREWETEMKLIA
jgi:hypothetical protein